MKPSVGPTNFRVFLGYHPCATIVGWPVLGNEYYFFLKHDQSPLLKRATNFRDPTSR